MSSDTQFAEGASASGYSLDGDIRIGGNYVTLVRDAMTAR
jgi:hypothetical protein